MQSGRYLLKAKTESCNAQPISQLANIAVTTSGKGNTAGIKTELFFHWQISKRTRLLKIPENSSRANGGRVIYKNSRLYLNLYLLFSVNLSNYEESLKQLSLIIRFFQYRNIFSSVTHPALPAGIEKLTLVLHTVSFQEQNNLWSIWVQDIFLRSFIK